MLNSSNNAARIKRRLAAEMVRLFRRGTLLAEIDALPVRFIPKDDDSYRCCIYKDRAMIRSRLIALMGFGTEEDDEIRLLSDYASEALRRHEHTQPVVSVIDMACSSCPGGKHRVTNLCRGCLARPCVDICPRGAVRFDNGRSTIDEKLCVNCGKCRDVCPYGAIVPTRLPCREACPVDAIGRKEGGRVSIDHEACVSCGHCARACPFGAVTDRSQLLDVLRLLHNDRQVAALVAPSAAGQFGGTPEQCVSALREIGFTSVHEVADAAATAARLEAEEWRERTEKGEKLATSCCPAYVETVRKHIPEFGELVSRTPSPMVLASRKVKESYPETFTVFIGPCIAKKQEGLQDPAVDFVLTFEEAGALMVGYDLDAGSQRSGVFDEIPGLPSDPEGLLFPRSGGVAQAVTNAVAQLDFPDRLPSCCRVEGLKKNNRRILKNVHTKLPDADFIEVMMCEGGCVNGPGTVAPPRIAEKELAKYGEQRTCVPVG